jgi:D-alanyl-D-alanine carboxypeptidase
VLVAGCSAAGDPPASSSTSATTATTPAPLPPTSPPPTSPSTTAPAWVVGATPLPLRPDGFGEIQPTPAALADRDLPTADLLPPPTSGGYESSIGPIDDDVQARMGGTWHDGCPVALEQLRYATVSFHGFDDRVHTGELVVHEDVAADVVAVFARLFDAGFPLEEMRLVTDADLVAPPTGDGNNTAAFVCRSVRGGSRFSAHASGLAIDVNPFQNPYRRGDVVLPELASAYLDRTRVRPGMLLDGDVVVEAFDAIGWSWGGRWDEPVDSMHFSATGG